MVPVHFSGINPISINEVEKDQEDTKSAVLKSRNRSMTAPWSIFLHSNLKKLKSSKTLK